MPVMQVLALSDGQIISAGADQIINVFDTRSLARVACMAFGGAVNDLAVTPDERLLFAVGTERDIKGYGKSTVCFHIIGNLETMHE